MIIVGHKDGNIQKLSSVVVTQKTKGYKTHTIIGGEFAVGGDNENIAFKTLLGSCVAIMFYDRKKRIKSMNHFLLPTTKNVNEDMKYGLYSVEAMLNEMYKLGCKKINMVAKISGGADVMNFTSDEKTVGYRNVEFARDFCVSEGFSLISEHTRGVNGRLVLLANEFETFIKVTKKSETNAKIYTEEDMLQREIKKAPVIKEYAKGIDLFEDNDKLEQTCDIELF